MLALTLTILALLHEPSPADFIRFGELTPTRRASCEYSPMRERYYAAWTWLQYCRRLHWPLYDNAGAVLADAQWRWACYDAADDLCNADCYPETRRCAARRLRGLLGPTDYFHGKLPSPWPEE